MKIGILQTGHVPADLATKHGSYPDMFAAFLAGNGFAFTTFSVVDNEFPTDIHSCDGWLITGSRHGVYEDHDWIPPLEDLIREIYAANIPMVGICFGHQIMAQALGGKSEWFGGQWGVGNLEYEHADGSPVTLLAMHQDQVTELPPDATVTMTSPYCLNAALSYNGKAISIQPHPEFSAPFVKELIHIRAGTVIPEDQASVALDSLERSNDSSRLAREIADFFKHAAAEKAA